jgi:4-hydroxybenzoyl-CoA thioesterase/acyl-CoA thioester hydrolase
MSRTDGPRDAPSSAPAAGVRAFRTRRRVEFVDTDMGGIVHFSRFFVFMETAEHLWLESLGTSVATVEDGRSIGWPRVRATCEYKSPARFGDVLDIAVRVERLGRSSVTYAFAFTCDGREIAHGSMVAVCCELTPGREVRPIPIPEHLARALGGGGGGEGGSGA